MNAHRMQVAARRLAWSLPLALCLVTGAGAGETAPESDAAAPEPASAREQLRRFGEGLESLTAEFTQVVTDVEGVLMDEGGGTVSMRRPNQFRWAYEGDFPELIVADGQRLWLYDEALEQVTVREQSSLATDSPLLLLTDPEGLDHQFQVTELGTVDGAKLLELSTDGTDVEFDRILIAFENDQPVSMVMEDAFGMRTDIRFGALERNPELDVGLFSFTPPEGVDVIGDTGEPPADAQP